MNNTPNTILVWRSALQLAIIVCCRLNSGSLSAFFFVIVLSTSMQAAPPHWWAKQKVLDLNATVNDYAAVNTGQLKYMAKKAYLEMEDVLPGGAGTDIENLIDDFETNTGNDYLAINIGQLKYVAKIFYDRLGYSYPWTPTTSDDEDYALVNVGQLKYVFGFQVPETGMWVQDTTIFDNSVRTDTLKTFCLTYGIESISLAILWNTDSAAISQADDMENFLNAMHTGGIKVNALFGNCDYIQNDSPNDFGFNFGKRFLNRVVEFIFDRKDDPSNRFDAIRIDVEPHLTGEPDCTGNWDGLSSAAKEERLQGLYDMLLVYQKIIDRDYGSNSNINNLDTSNMNSLSYTTRNWGTGERPDLILDVVPWYDDFGFTINLIGGGIKDANEAIFDIPDRISLLSYRNSYSGSNGLEAFTTDALSYLDTLDPPKPVTIGSEWKQGESSSVTFWNKTYTQFKSVRIGAEDNLLIDHGYISGFMYHQYTHSGSPNALKKWIENKISATARNKWKTLHFIP